MTLVTILMPMRDAEAYVLAALLSVLSEQEVPLELVVIDDGSSDRSRSVVEGLGDPRVRVVDGPRRGIAACLNTGLAAARGDLLMRCDADDLYPEGRIVEQVVWLRNHPDHDAVCGAMSTMDRTGALVYEFEGGAESAEEDIESELRRGVTRTSFCTFAVRRRAIERVGGFREYFQTSEDIDFLLRLGEVCRVGFIPRNAYFYRLHDASITHTQAGVRMTFFEGIAIQFQSERLAQGSDALQRGTPPVPPSAHGAPAESASQHIQGMLVGRAWRLHQSGDRGGALRVAARAVSHGPFALSAWRTLLLLAWRASRRRSP